MNISAVNCTPIKPEVSFGKSDDYEYTKLRELTTQLNDEFVESDDIKKPVSVIASVGLAAILAFASGKKIASLVKKAVPKAPESIEKALKSISNSLKSASSKLSVEEPISKLDKTKNLSSELIRQINDKCSKLYGKFAKNGADSAFSNAVGIAAAASVVPTICSRDNDGDGVSDIMQKGTNAYTGTKTRFDKVLSQTSILTDIAELLA